MLISIISDIHDNIANLQKCLNWSREKKIEAIICCGDVTKAETLEYLSKNFTGPIHLVRGNACLYEDNEPIKYKNIIYYGRIGNFKLDKYNIGLCHEPFLYEKVLEKDNSTQLIFCGHTHRPNIENKLIDHKEIQLLNPGTLGGVYNQASFSFWDTTNNELKLKLI